MRPGRPVQTQRQLILELRTFIILFRIFNVMNQLAHNLRHSLGGLTYVRIVEYLKMANSHSTQASDTAFNVSVYTCCQKIEHFQQIFQHFDWGQNKSTFIVFLSSSCRFLLCCSPSLKFMRTSPWPNNILAWNISSRSEISFLLHENGKKSDRR